MCFGGRVDHKALLFSSDLFCLARAAYVVNSLTYWISWTSLSS